MPLASFQQAATTKLAAEPKNERIVVVPVLHPDEQKALQIQDENVVDSARIGSKVFVSIKNVCAFFGLQAQRQTTHIRDHAILSQGIRLIALKTRGGFQNTLCLDAEMIPTWFVILQPKRAKPEFQQLIIEYQSSMTQAIRDVYFIQALATNPRHAHLAGILENLFSEIRSRRLATRCNSRCRCC